MIGLNSTNDSSTSRLKAPTHHKTHRFASGLKDRFYSTGVSGSMQQHQTMENKKMAVKVGLRTAREIHQANVEKELEDDARQLAELEEKLMEIRRQKRIRQERKEARKQARMHNKKALLIQEAWAAHVQRQNDKAVDLIKKFIRTCANKQAAIIGGWAAGAIKKFAVKASYVWLEEKRRKEVEMQEIIRKLEEEDRQRMAAYARSQVVESSLDTIFTTVYTNAAIRRKKKSSVLTPQRKRKMKNAHRILEPNIIEQQMQGDRPISPITTPLKQGSPPRPAATKSSPSVAKIVTSEPTKQPKQRVPVDKVPTPTRKPIIVKKPNPADERKKKIAAMHQKRLEDMEIERLRRLERVEQLKLEAEAAAERQKLQKQVEDEEKSRKKVEFMLRLEEQQAQLAREAEIVRTIREKSQKEKEEEDARQKIELKLMAQYDNFYVITPNMLGGGNMSLQKRLFSRAPSALGEDAHAGPGVVSRSNSSVPKKVTPRVSSAPYHGNSRGRDSNSNGGSACGGRAMEKSVSAGTETFQVPGELSMTALRPSGPDGILEHMSSEAMDLARPHDGNDGVAAHRSAADWNEGRSEHLNQDFPKATQQKKFAPGVKSEKYLAQHKAKMMMMEANELEKKLREDEEAEKKAAALMLAREQAQKRIADRAKAEREKQLELERQEENRRLSMESEAAKQAREATRRRVAERTRQEKEKKAEAAELEEEKKKKQAELLEKAHVLMVKTKKMTYAMNKMKSKNKKAPKKNSSHNAAPFVELQLHGEASSPSELRLHLGDEGSSENDNRQAKNAAIAAQFNSGTGKALPDLNKLVPPSLSSFGIGPSPTPAGDSVVPTVPTIPSMAKEKRSSKVGDSKKSGKVSDLLDMVARAREKLNVSTEGGDAEYEVAASAEENFTAAYSAPVRKKNNTAKKSKKDPVDDKPFKPLTMDEMMKALEGRPGFSMSPLSMDCPNMPVGNSTKVDTGKKSSGQSKSQKKPQKSGSKLNHPKDKPPPSHDRSKDVDNGEQSDDFDEDASGYEDMLNDECERLRAVLEKKMSSSLKPEATIVEGSEHYDEHDADFGYHDSAVGDREATDDANAYVSAASNAFTEYMNNAGEKQEEFQEGSNTANDKYSDDDEEEDLFGGRARDLASMEREYGGDAFANLDLELKPF